MTFYTLLFLTCLSLGLVKSFLHSPVLGSRWGRISSPAHSAIAKPEKRFFNKVPNIRVYVGGMSFSIAKSAIEKHPGSFFHNMNCVDMVCINRDANLFQYVYAFLIHNFLPRDKSGNIALDDETLEGVKAEAEFYGLKALSEECNESRKEFDLPSVFLMKKYVKYIDFPRDPPSYALDTPQDALSPLMHALSPVWAESCLSGKSCYKGMEMCLTPEFRDSTYLTLGINERDPHEESTVKNEPVESLPHTTEIELKHLDLHAVQALVKHLNLKYLAPHLSIEVRPQKMVIHRAGSHFHHEPVRGEGHIGTLVYTLNSEHTGGELEVSHNGHTEKPTEFENWVAVSDEGQLRSQPVKSGARVSMIYDIYGHNDSRSNPQYAADVNIFWRSKDAVHINTTARTRTIPAVEATAIKTALDQELARYDNVTIGLQHWHPDSQPTPTELKGGDRALYDLLSEQYDVQVSAMTIVRRSRRVYPHTYWPCNDDAYGEETNHEVFVNWFSPAIMKEALAREWTWWDRKNTPEELLALQTSKIVLPFRPSKQQIVSTNICEWDEITVYMANALLVKKKQ